MSADVADVADVGIQGMGPLVQELRCTDDANPPSPDLEQVHDTSNSLLGNVEDLV